MKCCKNQYLIYILNGKEFGEDRKMKCCENQYLIFNEDGYLSCVNCGTEDTGDYNK